MKLSLYLLLLLSLFGETASGQAAQTTPSGTLIANQNPNTAMPASAILELRSTNKGMLPPRMTTAQMNAIASPAIGLMVFDTDVKCLKTYNGTSWECANANLVAATPLSSSFAFQSVTDNYTYGESIVADNSGNNISVGYFAGAVTFGKSPNIMTLTSLGGYDGFLAKHDKDGNLLWATQIGGANNDQEINDVAIDNAGNIAITGYIRYSASFFSTNGSQSDYTNNSYYSKIFVAKYNSSGILLWYKIASSSGNYDCYGQGITFDTQNDVLVTGMYRGTVSFDAISLASNNNTEDIFIGKLAAANGAFSWVKSSGSSDNTENGHELVCDLSNNVYVYGQYTGTATFGEGGATITISSRGLDDVFVAKYSSAGVLGWVRTAGSTNDEGMGGIAYSSVANAIYITGSYKSTLTFGSGLGSNSQASVGSNGYYNGFLAKYDLNGNILWATRQGSTSNYHNYCNDVSVDGFGNPYVGGELEYNTNFYSVGSANTSYFRGVDYNEPFIAKYNVSGNLLWVVVAVDGTGDDLKGIDIKNNIAFTLGSFAETINFGYQQLTSTNNSYHGNLFIWRYAE